MPWPTISNASKEALSEVSRKACSGGFGKSRGISGGLPGRFWAMA